MSPRAASTTAWGGPWPLGGLVSSFRASERIRQITGVPSAMPPAGNRPNGDDTMLSVTRAGMRFTSPKNSAANASAGRK